MSEVIVIDSTAFYALIEKILHKVDRKYGTHEDKWIDDREAMKLLKCSKTKLWSLRTNDQIKFSQHSRKCIMYDRESILEFLEKHSNK